MADQRDIEILDRQTAETLQRLIAAGLLQQTGQTVPLYPVPEPPRLSAETRIRMAKLKAEAERSLSMARLLLGNGFADGAIAPLQKSVRQLTVFQTLGKGLPESGNTELDFSNVWKQPVLEFMQNPAVEQGAGIADTLADTISKLS